MARVGILCPSWLGHLNPMCNLGKELQRRGHHVTLFGWPDVEEKIKTTGLGFYELGAQDFPSGSLSVLDDRLSKLEGIEEIRFFISLALMAARMMFREAPEAIHKSGVNFLLIDQITFSGGTIADHLRLPFVSICSGLPLQQEPGIPPNSSLWKYRNVWWDKLRNQLGHHALNYLTRSIWDTVIEQRRRFKLPAYLHRDDAFSPLAQICQFPKALDFPREKLPPWFHYVGSLKSQSGIEPIYCNQNKNFPSGILGHKPLIYASLGTSIFNRRKEDIFQIISEACLELDVQLLIDLGDPAADSSKTDFPGALVFPFAPHQQIIDRASLVITHAGSTVINCLQVGVPMVAIPITHDHPGIAARIARAGAGEVVPLGHLGTTTLKNCIEKVLSEPGYRANAERLSDEIKKSGGLPRAVDIIEQAINTRAPVINV